MARPRHLRKPNKEEMYKLEIIIEKYGEIVTTEDDHNLMQRYYTGEAEARGSLHARRMAKQLEALGEEFDL